MTGLDSRTVRCDGGLGLYGSRLEALGCSLWSAQCLGGALETLSASISRRGATETPGSGANGQPADMCVELLHHKQEDSVEEQLFML